MHELKAKTLRGGLVPVTYDFVPDECPICHCKVNPVQIAAVYDAEESDKGTADLIWQCTSSDCKRAFIGVYRSDPRKIHYHGCVLVWPRTADPASFAEEIVSISPTFVDIYNQAMEAESSELDQLVGIGLRKALEFLVKDFAVHQRKEEEAEIRRTFLKKVIDDFIDDPSAQAVAKRAAWLGNDEAHYTRRWEEKDITDLKRLIRLTVNAISNVLLTEKYLDEMPE